MNGEVRVAVLGLLLGIAVVTAPTSVVAQAEARTFHIPAGELNGALQQFSAQSRIQLIYPAELAAGKKSASLSGDYTPTEALRRLLKGSGLELELVNDKTVVLKPAEAPAVGPAPAARARPDKNSADGSIEELETVAVTGSRIRGGTMASPLITIDAAQIREQGFTDLGEVIRSVPQNFTGGQNPGIVGAVGNVANQDVTGGSGLNLRGLGPDATLTLLNGRRMSYDGQHQSVDVSSIPVAAVERLEIVADGASAVYGSDAVGGVGNVILKRDFEGVTLAARYGNATDGGLTTREYDATAGTTWSSGGVILAYRDVSADPIYKDQRSYTQNMYEPSTIYAGNSLRSALLSLHQSLSEAIQFRLDALRAERELLSYSGQPTYYMYDRPEIGNSYVSPNVEVSLPGDWTLSLGGSWGKGDLTTRTAMVDRATGIPGPIRTCVCNESVSYEASVEGPVFALGGGDARLAVGVGHRSNDYLLRRVGVTGNATFTGEESGRFAYAELNLPFIGPESGIAGVRRLALTAAMRGEDYDTFGSVNTPKLGLVYAPIADVTFKASWGKSFKAPTLDQRHSTSVVYLDPANWYGSYADDANVLFVSGGNPELGPERARTWTASLVFHPESLDGLEVELSWFEIEYTDRVVYPVSFSSNEVLSDPANAPFTIFSPSAEQQAALLASVDVNYAGTSYDPGTVIAILDSGYTNVALQDISGIDLSSSYGFDVGVGRLTIRGSASLLDSSQRTTAGQRTFELAGTRGSPAEVNARAGVVWDWNGVTASAFANYTGGVTISAATAGAVQKTASFTTFDTTVRYDATAFGGMWSGLELALSAQNLFDRTPPLYTTTSATAPRYDSTNYSSIGRFWSVSVSKHW